MVKRTTLVYRMILKSAKVFIYRLFSFEKNLDSLLSIVIFAYWMFGILMRRAVTQYYDDTIDYLHAKEHVKIF